jgi:hypothetical protein
VKRSAVKLDIYRKFSNALAAVVFASVAWIAYEVSFLAKSTPTFMKPQEIIFLMVEHVISSVCWFSYLTNFVLEVL